MDAQWATPEALLELWRSLARVEDTPAAVSDVLADKLAALLGAAVSIDLLTEDGTLRRAAARGLGEGASGGRVDDVARSGRAHRDANTVVVPLRAREVVLGALSASRSAPAFRDADLDALQEIADCAGLAVDRARARVETSKRMEALAESEGWLRDLIESSPVVIFLKDIEGRYVTMNKRSAGNMHRRVEEVIGKTTFDLLPRDLAESFHRIDRQVIESGAPIETEDKFLLAGEWHVFLAAKFPVRDAAGRIRGTAGMATEITNRMRAMEALSRGREQLGFITDSLPALVCYLDTGERYQYLNKAHEEWFGIAQSQFSNRTLRDFVDPRAYETMRPYIDRTLRGESCTFEATLGGRTNTPARHTRVTFSPHRNFSGQVEGFVALITDVTEHKLAEGRNRLLADASKLLSASFDYQKALRRLAEIVVPGFADRCQIEIDARYGHGSPFAVAHPEGPGLAAGGSAARPLADPLQTFTAPVTIHEETVGHITLERSPARQRFEASDLAVAEELARRIALAVENAHLYGEAQRAIRLRDEFMSIASHELRTPLTSLSLDLEVLMRLLERQGAEVRTMQRATKLGAHLGRLKQLVLTLLDVSQIEAGRLAIQAEALDLRIVVGEVIDRFAEPAVQSQCALCPELPPDAVHGAWDRLRIDQILTNLLSNAIRYAPGRPIDISLAAAATTVTLTVRDHGPGIRPEDRERIFGRFERAVSGRGIGGFGLGLWITRQVVLALGGTIRVESLPNVETSFVIELPRRDGPLPGTGPS
jgi:PAS domain S-box-containing protein